VAYQIEWAESALESLIEAIEYTARASPSYAAALANRAERAAASLDQFPERGRSVAEFNDAAVRELQVGSYRLIYRVRPAKVVILAFVHGSRDLGRLLSDSPQ
jgi:toxin ParE1/3/4